MSAEGKIPASVSIVACNEEGRIKDCLESVTDFEEIIVIVDAKSADRTAEICRDHGCKVFIEEWKGYGQQKNSAISKCSGEWVIVVDADERIPAETKDAIMKILDRPEAAAYRLRRKNFLHDRWMRHSGYWPDRQVRLVNRNRGSFRGEIHEKWETDGPVRDVDAVIEHRAFSGYAEMIDTLNGYSTVIAGLLYDRGRRANPFSPVVHGAGMFVKIYLLERGFLDGIDGLVTALLKGGGSFFKYAKLLELQRREIKSPLKEKSRG